MKIIHCADIHLDSPMETHMNAEQASERNTEIIQTFVRLTRYAEENGVRIVLIAGDLFDGERVKSRTVDEILDAMGQTPGVDYLCLSGNHDDTARAFADRSLPENVKQFRDRWETYLYDDVAVSGIEMRAENAESLYQEIPHAEGCVNIVTLHGQTGYSCGVDQVNLKLLKERGIDYLALGHLHSYTLQPLDQNGVYAYAGCLEGRGFDECGEKGFVLLTVEGGRVIPRFVPFSSRRLYRIPADITGLTQNAEILRQMENAAQEIRREDMVEFVLTGYSDPTVNLSLSYLQNMIKNRFFFTKIKNESRIAIDPEVYKNDISLKGEFIRLVLDSDASEEEKASLIRTGIQALTGEEITI